MGKYGATLAKLSRKTSHRMALLRNLTAALIRHERIETTYAKAKAAHRVAEKIITLGKRDTAFTKRKVRGFLYDHDGSLTRKLHTELKKRYAQRAGGYTRVQRLPARASDQAAMGVLELVDSPLPNLPKLNLTEKAFERALSIRTFAVKQDLRSQAYWAEQTALAKGVSVAEAKKIAERVRTGEAATLLIQQHRDTVLKEAIAKESNPDAPIGRSAGKSQRRSPGVFATHMLMSQHSEFALQNHAARNRRIASAALSEQGVVRTPQQAVINGIYALALRHRADHIAELRQIQPRYNEAFAKIRKEQETQAQQQQAMEKEAKKQQGVLGRLRGIFG
ncbi:hypothetical protein CAOG_03771 [Capsaspora owczarzaki ATCC 30864]|uniref:Ribosomal protein L17 n=1 Tax=Capsaspora owczarzaki (strain ATCC 30864) TaxID=595528 RepID=A0A0D2WPY1_CAPO3|nr:hypothetical protein CAOG_03771 [Capsaspora owczarzaki ATCC 30864]KJE92883.1 hypothetical protein CAOG_003771 [Capsaspora owczarzaki ATCC 30864]|eukprot:XP_004363499.2 hypothetical protein CAOG_03771 [Capsaspora owczarzaki ATCC 30864]